MWDHRAHAMNRGALRPAAGYALIVLAIALTTALLTCAGCGPAAQQHRTLNLVTDIADPTYDAALDGCDAARDFIVARQGSTEAQDVSDMQAINDVCDTVVDGFEVLRGTQITARAYIDNGLEGAATEAVRQALAAWADLQALVPRIQRLTSGGES